LLLSNLAQRKFNQALQWQRWGAFFVASHNHPDKTALLRFSYRGPVKSRCSSGVEQLIRNGEKAKMILGFSF
jgi:hypothetical protein